MRPFLDELLERRADWRAIPLVGRSGSGWRGLALAVPTPPEADVGFPLDIEVVGEMVTVSFDYSHLHMTWPPNPNVARSDGRIDALALIDAILVETVASASWWGAGRCLGGSLCQTTNLSRSPFRRADRLRVRSWKGAFNRDEALPAGGAA